MLSVGTSQDEAGKEFVEHDPVKDAGAMAPQRMSDGPFGKQRKQKRPPLRQTRDCDRGERRAVRSMRRP